MTTITYTIKQTSELREGDLVNCHGMLCRIDQPIEVSNSHPIASDGSRCRYTRALVTNRDEVPHAAVPLGWTREDDGTHRWTIQGNDRARWAVVDESSKREPITRAAFEEAHPEAARRRAERIRLYGALPGEQVPAA